MQQTGAESSTKKEHWTGEKTYNIAKSFGSYESWALSLKECITYDFQTKLHYCDSNNNQYSGCISKSYNL